MNQLGVLEAVEAYERISEQLDLGRFALALAVSLAAALAVAWLYRAFCESRGTGSQLWRAFPSLCFRTPVKEPEEVGSVMLVIASSIAAATFHFAFIAVMLAFAAACALAAAKMRGARLFRRDGLLVLSMPDASAANLGALRAALDGAFARHSVQSAASAGGTTTVQVSFSGLRSDPCSLQVAVRAAVPAAGTVNVFLDRPGGFR